MRSQILLLFLFQWEANRLNTSLKQCQIGAAQHLDNQQAIYVTEIGWPIKPIVCVLLLKQRVLRRLEACNDVSLYLYFPSFSWILWISCWVHAGFPAALHLLDKAVWIVERPFSAALGRSPYACLILAIIAPFHKHTQCAASFVAATTNIRDREEKVSLSFMHSATFTRMYLQNCHQCKTAIAVVFFFPLGVCLPLHFSRKGAL